MNGRHVRRPEANRFRSPRVLATVCFVFAVAAALSVVPPHGLASGEDLVRVVGHLDRRTSVDAIGANGNLLIDAPNRTAYQAVTTAGETMLYETNLDTLALKTKWPIPTLQYAFPVAGTVEWFWTLDQQGGRIFALTQGRDPQTNQETYPLVSIDLKARRSSPPATLWPAITRVPMGFSYHRGSDRLYFLTRGPADALRRNVMWLEERTTDGTLVWEYRLASCWGATDQQYPPVVARSTLNPDSLYLNCYNSGGIQGQVVRVTLGEGGPVREERFPAVPGPLSAIFDYGSDRLIFLTTNGGAGRGAWVFDGIRSSFLGVIASGDARAGASDYGMGLDPSTGRLYMQTPAGFIVADARRTPLPGGLLFRKLAMFGVGTIHVDPHTHRVFVQDSNTLDLGRQPARYLVLEDRVPPSRDPKLGNPDDLTADIAEQAGVTAVNYSGGARAYALRSLTTGGLQKLAWNAAIGTFSPEDTGMSSLDATIKQVPVAQASRDVSIARVRQLALANDSADASAVLSESDSGTHTDLRRAEQSWPFPPVDCSDDGETPATKAGTGAAAGCDARNAIVTASSSAQGAGDDSGALVSARSLLAFGAVQRDARLGVVARSIAVAQDVKIGGRVTIGEIRAQASSRAKGRPGTTLATFERTIEGVRIDSDGDGDVDYRCDSCDPRTVDTQIEEALGGQVAIEFPEPDPVYFGRGSQGGYQAVVQKETFRGYAERALNEDDSPEVPGMQIVVYGDARAGRSRQVVQIAGVQAESHYGIYVLPKESEGDPCPPDCGDEPEPVVTITKPVPVLGTKTVAPKPTGPTKITETVLRRFAAGTAIAIAKPGRALLLGSLWVFLLLPVYLTWRRRFVGGSRSLA